MSFLPDPFPYDGNMSKWAELEERLHKQFCDDFVNSPFKFKDKPVKLDFTLNEGKEKGFWHVTTRDFMKTGVRAPESQRALRIHWIRLIITSYDHHDVTYFCYPEPNSRIRHYFWVTSEDYIVILEEVKNAFILITAYVIDHEHMRRDFDRKLENQCSCG